MVTTNIKTHRRQLVRRDNQEEQHQRGDETIETIETIETYRLEKFDARQKKVTSTRKTDVGQDRWKTES